MNRSENGILSVALTIAGSDSGGGAGIQTDLKAFHCLGVFGTSAITAITAQNPNGVRSVQAVDPDVVRDQIDVVLDCFDVRAIKTGMLFSAEIVEVVAERLGRCGIPLVVDPVMIATSGAALLQNDAIAALRCRLLPCAKLVTPNLPEASLLLEREVTAGSAQAAAVELAERLACAVLVKGGHGAAGMAVDWLASAEGVCGISAPRVDAATTHGTGCALSAAIAAGLACGLGLREAVVQARSYIHGNLCGCRRVGENVFAMMPSDELPSAAVQVIEPLAGGFPK